MNAVTAAKEPIYPLSYAARLAGLNTQTAKRWLYGYDYRRKGTTRQSAPVIHLAQAAAVHEAELTFEELLTLRLVRAFREEACLGLTTIKAAAKVATTLYGVGNPFVMKVFRSDGRKVFLELQASGAVRGHERRLVEALTGQQQFREVVEPSLFKDVVFVGEEPTQWRPQGKERSVVIRPDRAFGAPHIDGTGIRTDVVADAVIAEGGGSLAFAAVAAWFGLTDDQVGDAVAAEAKWRQKKAS